MYSADCMENSCLLCGILHIKFTVEKGLKKTIKSEKPIAINSKIDIQPVNAKHFFKMAQKKKYEGYL